MLYLKITRPINLLIIVLTQLLFWFCIIQPVHNIYGTVPHLQFWQVILLILSTVLIAAGGYVINDYYDLPIDLVNKPEKVIVSNGIDDDAAFNYFAILTVLGLAASLIVAITLGNYRLFIIPFIITSMLWFYAQSLKRMFFVGNFIVSIATAAVIFLLIYFGLDWVNVEFLKEEANEIIFFGKGYMAFAFVVSMLRELVKDMQDKEGDEEFESKTIPIVLGIRNSKLIALFWLLLVIVGVVFVQKGLIQGQQWLAFGYTVVFIQLLNVWIGFKILQSQNSEDFGKASNWIKGLMFFGLITMIYIGLQLKQYGQTIDSWL